MPDVVKKLTIRSSVEGADQTQRDLKGVQSAYEGVAKAAEITATVTERVSRSGLSTAEAYRRQTLRLDEVARAQDQMSRATKVANAALDQGVISQGEHAQRLDLIKTRYDQQVAAVARATAHVDKYANASGLARHELINFGRQVQDVGVSLASGQSPFTVLVQQGAQIADIFASSQGSIRGFFQQVGTSVSAFLTPVRLAIGATATFAATAVLAVSSWSSGQRDISRALMGIGQASGVTREQINDIGRTSASAFGLSVGQAREAATAFASTGRIYGENTAAATNLLNDLVRAGADATEQQKKLGEAMLDPAAGALELNKSLGFLNAETLNYIRNLQTQGRLQEAQRVLLEASAPAARKQAEEVGGLSRMWTLAANSASEYWDTIKQGTAIAAQRLTGVDFGGLSTETNLAQARQRLQALQSGPFQGPLAQPMIEAQRKEVERLEQALKKAAEASADQRFAMMTITADAAARAIVSEITQIEKLTMAVEALARAREAREARGLPANAQEGNAENIARVQLALAVEAEAVEGRRAERVREIAAAHQGVGIQTAMTLETMNSQLAIASSITGQERLIAQEKATILALTNQGKDAEEAILIAAKQRAIAQAEINANAERQLTSAREQLMLAQAGTNEQRLQVQEIIRRNQLIREGVDGPLAAQIAAMEKQVELAHQAVIEEQKRNAEAERLAQQEQRNNEIMRQRISIMRQNEIAAMNYFEELHKIWVEMLNISHFTLGGNPRFGTQFADSSGKPNQYTSTGTGVMPANLAGAGIGGVAMMNGVLGANQQGLTAIIDSVFRFGGSVVDAIDRVIKAGPITDTSSQVLNQLTNLLPESERASVIERELSLLRSQPQTLARETLIKQLTDSLDQLKQSTDALNSTITLSDIYATDPRTSHIGFRAGFADGGSFVVPGGYSANDNYMAHLPVASGETVTVSRGSPEGEGAVTIDARIIIQGSVDEATLERMKVSQFQQAQRLAKSARMGTR